MYALSDIRYETRSFFVLAVPKGFEVLEKRGTHSVRVASVGNGPAPSLGIVRARAEANRRQALADASHDAAANNHKLEG
jgi:hypothetical protein